MAHKHFCDAVGHYWDCEGTALRPLAGIAGATVCMCLTHDVPMESGDHSRCPVELLACPVHREEQLRLHTVTPGSPTGHRWEITNLGPELADEEAKSSIGFCLWCNQDFHTMAEMEAHVANDSEACAAFQRFKQDAL